MSSLRDGAAAFTEAGISAYIDRTARNVVQYMIEKNLTVSAAESCTGGILSAAITSVPGASKIFECGIVSYSERIKEEILGVPAEIIDGYGVVSAQTADAMAKAVKKLSGSDISVGITGLAGPASPSDALPVGTVYISTAYKDRIIAENLKLYELGSFDRGINRLLAAAFALEALQKRLGLNGN